MIIWKKFLMMKMKKKKSITGYLGIRCVLGGLQKGNVGFSAHTGAGKTLFNCNGSSSSYFKVIILTN